MDRGAWWATVHGVTKSQTGLKQLSTHARKDYAFLECKVKWSRLFATPWTVAYQAPPSMRFSRQEYWSGLPLPSPGDLPDPGIKPRYPALQADALSSEPPRKPNQRSNCQHPLNHRKSKRAPEKHLLLLYWLCQSLWLCGSQQTVEYSSRDGNTIPPYLPPEKFVCRSRSNS